MVRIIIYTLTVIALVSLSVWAADRPGTVILEWLGWRIDTTIPILLLLILLATGALALALRLLGLLRTLPYRVRQQRTEHRRRKGYAALSAGFVAIATGNANWATRMANEARRHLADPDTGLLLQAQAAELAGDEVAVRKYYGLLCARPATELIGLKGLMAEAHRTCCHEEVLDLARRAVAIQRTDWAVRNLFEALVRVHLWAEASATLAYNPQADAFKREEAAHYQVVLDTQQALEADASCNHNEALRLVRRALNQDAGMVPAIILTARLYTTLGKARKAARVVRKAWCRTPHPGLVQVYFDIWPGDDALKRIQRVERLIAGNSNHPESRLLVAGAALEAQLWGQARSQLTLLLAEVPSQRAATLMARLEQSEHNDTAAANDWLQRASTSPADAGWRCRACSTDVARWEAFCFHCGSFDSLAWIVPSRALVATPMIVDSTAAAAINKRRRGMLTSRRGVQSLQPLRLFIPP